MRIPIKAAVVRSVKATPVIEELMLDDPHENEVVVAIHACGICHTDLVIRDQHFPTPLPMVLGHEGAGVVEAVGSAVSTLEPGDHVVLSFDSCGHCRACADALPCYCDSFFPLNFGGCRTDGSTTLHTTAGEPVHGNFFGQSSFATRAIVHARNAVKVDSDLPLEVLAPLGCGFQTGAGAVLKVLRPRPNSSLAVIGTGPVGLSAVMAAVIAGATTIVAVDVNQDRIAFAREVGATHSHLGATAPLSEIAAASGCPNGFDYIIDTTGSPAVVTDAARALATRGELALLGAYPPGTAAIEPGFLMGGGRAVRGVIEGESNPQQFIPELIAHYRAGRFPIDRLIAHFAFADIAEAFEAGESGAVIKPVLRMT